MSDLVILFQNADFVAVDKPAGLAVHNNEGGGDHLLTVMARQLKVDTLYPVHRLDKETSGVQVLALNATAAKNLAAQFENKTVKKTYVGLLRGALPKTEGVWNKALTDKAEGRRKPSGDGERVPCETRYKVLKASKYFTFCEFDLITGRQHQIRKHAALDNHPLVGDARYGDPKYNKKMAEIYKIDRMLLHCQRLEISGEKIESPTPKDFEAFF